MVKKFFSQVYPSVFLKLFRKNVEKLVYAYATRAGGQGYPPSGNHFPPAFLPLLMKAVVTLSFAALPPASDEPEWETKAEMKTTQQNAVASGRSGETQFDFVVPCASQVEIAIVTVAITALIHRKDKAHKFLKASPETNGRAEFEAACLACLEAANPVKAEDRKLAKSVLPKLLKASPEKLDEVGKALGFDGPATTTEDELARQFADKRRREEAAKSAALNDILS